MDMLDNLTDITLTGFQDMESTPTTVVASLPASQDEKLDMGLDADILAQSVAIHRRLRNVPIDIDASSFLLLDYTNLNSCPGAPYMKDLDSFSDDGLTEGDFDFLVPEFTHDNIVDSDNLSLLTKTSTDVHLNIERWRSDVSAKLTGVLADDDDVRSTTPAKRPRSVAADDEDDERCRIKARTLAKTPSDSLLFSPAPAAITPPEWFTHEPMAPWSPALPD